MSEFFISSKSNFNYAKIKSQLTWTSYTHSWAKNIENLSWVATRVDSPDIWAPAYDNNTKTFAIVLGRLAFDELDWNLAEKLPYKGGLASRLVLYYWDKKKHFGIERFNGSALIIIVEESRRKFHLWTDRLGLFPSFYFLDHRVAISSNQDVLANTLKQSAISCKFNITTMAEFLMTGTSVHPNTYWTPIRQMDAGSYYCFSSEMNKNLIDNYKYWRPSFFYNKNYISNRLELVERLENALLLSIKKRTLPRLGKVGVLLSSGADSRAALFAANKSEGITAFTLYDEINPELIGAESLAKIANCKHIKFKREKDYYFKNAEQAIKYSSGMWSIDSAHYGGVIDLIKSENIDVLLTGCYADYLLKGLAYNRKNKTLFKKNLPLYEFVNFSYQWYQPFSLINHSWRHKVEERLDRYFDEFKRSNFNSNSIAEFLRLSPIIREADAIGRHTLRCTLPHDFFISDNEILEIFGSMSPDQKINGIPFGMAVERITGKAARSVLNNNYSARVGAQEFERIFDFILASIKRKIKSTYNNKNSISSFGSWPHFPNEIKKSETLKSWDTSQDKSIKELIISIIGEEKFSWTLNDWAERDSFLLMRYFTASSWLSQNPSAMQDISYD
jgi:asparagine synthase (glutamine-hydrolysing)